MEKISIRTAFKTGWKQFLARPWYLMVLGLSIWGLVIMGSTSNAAFTALGYIIIAGYMHVMLKHARGDSFVFDDLFSLDNRWISFVFLAMIKAFFIILGLILFIVPGVYLIVKWMFAEYYVVDKGMRPMEALRASSKLTEGHRWKIFFFMLASIVAVWLGILVFVVGVLASTAIVFLATISMYRQLQGEETNEA